MEVNVDALIRPMVVFNVIEQRCLPVGVTVRLLYFSFAIWVQISFATVYCYENITVFMRDDFVKVPQFCIDDDAGVVVMPVDVQDVVDGAGKTIIPGLIDVQLNGAYGFDFTSAPESVQTVAKRIVKTGVTAFSPTMISSSATAYERAARAIVPGRIAGSAEVLKLHVEGPFISISGTHSHEAIRCAAKNGSNKISIHDLYHHYGSLWQKIGLITLAPEQNGGKELIADLCREGIIVSLGHSNATCDEGIEALEQGAAFFTHLYNAMSPIHHRTPGLPVAALIHESSRGEKPFYGMIADGIHVHPHMIRLAFAANQNMITVTDAMAGLGEPQNSIVTIGDEEVKIVEHGSSQGAPSLKAIKVQDGDKHTLAGSVITMIESLNNLRQFLPNASWAQIIKTATTNPATLLDIASSKDLRVGSDADFLVIEGDFLCVPPSLQCPSRIVIQDIAVGGQFIE